MHQTSTPERDALEITFPRVEGYRVELPEDKLAALFTRDSVLELTPELVGPSVTQNQGIVGEGVELNMLHMNDIRQSTIMFELTKHLLYNYYRDPNQEPKLHLFGQLKRIVRQWLDGGYLRCTGGTSPAQLQYQEIKEMACDRIKTAITEASVGDRPIKAILDAYNPTGSTVNVSFTTSKTDRWQTDPRRCQINWIVLDSDWEAEFCRVAEAHPRVRAYVKNHNLGLEVPAPAPPPTSPNNGVAAGLRSTPPASPSPSLVPASWVPATPTTSSPTAKPDNKKKPKLPALYPPPTPPTATSARASFTIASPISPSNRALTTPKSM